MISARRTLVLAALIAAGAGCANPDRGVVRVAVAGNFALPMQELVAAFESEHSVDVEVSLGSTGQLFTQIVHGAPFDIFFAADTERPAAVVQRGLAPDSGRFSYAIGQLAVVYRAGVDTRDLMTGRVRTLAIANPALAPYGTAARRVLDAWGLEARSEVEVVQGANVAQAFQFVATGAADAGLVSRAHAQTTARYDSIPFELYGGIHQDAVVLSDAPAAWAFAAYVRSPAAQNILTSFGYLAVNGT